MPATNDDLFKALDGIQRVLMKIQMDTAAIRQHEDKRVADAEAASADIGAQIEADMRRRSGS